MRGIHRLLIAAAPFVAAGCGATAPTGDAGPPVQAADVAATPAIRFTPATVAVVRGGTVTFDFGAVAHDVFFDGVQPGAPENIPGDNANVSRTLVFTTAGTFHYNCHIHPGMSGTVVVVDTTR